MNEYKKGYDARQDGDEVNFSKSSDWLSGWYAANSDIAEGKHQRPHKPFAHW